MSDSVPFGSLLSKIIDNRGKTCPTSEDGIPLIATNCIKNEHLYPVYEKVRYVSQEIYDTWFRGHPEPGDLIFVLKGTPGRVNWVNDPVDFCIAQDMVALRVDESKVYPKYLFAVLRSSQIQQEIEGLHVGSLIPHFKKSDFDDLQIPLVEQKLQKYIGDTYFNLSLKIDLLHRQNKTLEAMAETLFRQWFIEDAKEDWEKVTLGEVVNITSSKRIFYSEYVDEGIPFYRSKEIIELNKSGQTRSDLFISNERFDEIEAKFGAPVEGDILLTSVGTLGVTYQVKANDRFYFKDGNLTWFKDFKRISSNIIFCWLNSKDGKEQLDNISIGSTQAALTIQGLKSLELNLPSPDVIQKLDEQLVGIYQKVQANQSQIQTLENLRDTLLPKLMSGEVRVQYQTEEVA